MPSVKLTESDRRKGLSRKRPACRAASMQKGERERARLPYSGGKEDAASVGAYMGVGVLAGAAPRRPERVRSELRSKVSASEQAVGAGGFYAIATKHEFATAKVRDWMSKTRRRAYIRFVTILEFLAFLVLLSRFNQAISKMWRVPQTRVGSRKSGVGSLIFPAPDSLLPTPD